MSQRTMSSLCAVRAFPPTEHRCTCLPALPSILLNSAVAPSLSLTSTELPLLREPPVSVPPGLKSSPSRVMQRVDTSRANASFLAVPASCWGVGAGHGG